MSCNWEDWYHHNQVHQDFSWDVRHLALNTIQVIQKTSDWSCVTFDKCAKSQRWLYGVIIPRRGGRGSTTSTQWLYVTGKPEIHKLLFLSYKWSLFGVFFGHEMIFVILYPAIDFKTSRIPTVKNYVSRSREDDFIPHPASNFLCIPHPAKPMLDPLLRETHLNL